MAIAEEENPNTPSILDNKQSHIFNYPMTVRQQIWLIFVLPVFLLSIFYIIDVATDIAIGCALINENHLWAGIVTLLLTYTAPLISYLTALSNIPPENELKELAIWFLLETLAFLLYPLRPLQCFAERIFWAVEALRTEDPLREDALVNYEGTKKYPIENYLFFQGIVHAGPQMLFQLVLLLLRVSTNPNTEKVQVVGILSSLATLSLITMSYHRYETQVNAGRQEVWPKDVNTVDTVTEMLLLNPPSTDVPVRKKWMKVMEEDNPLGKTVLFLFWYLFLFSRCLCLVLAAEFYVWAVLGVCLAHYIFCFFYILPISGWKNSICIKLLLSFLYIFCLIEVGIQFRKSTIFYTLFIVFTYVENGALTTVWAICAKWDGWWHHYCLYLLGITHIASLILLFIYTKYFQPDIKRIPPKL